VGREQFNALLAGQMMEQQIMMATHLLLLGRTPEQLTLEGFASAAILIAQQRLVYVNGNRGVSA